MEEENAQLRTELASLREELAKALMLYFCIKQDKYLYRLLRD